MSQLVRLLVAMMALWLLSGCSIGTQYWPSDEEMKAFLEAGPIEPELDVTGMLSGLPKSGPYKVVAGDLLEIRGAGGFMSTSSDDGATTDIIQTRVQEDGTIGVPLVGALLVGPNTSDKLGRKLTEIENIVADAMHPKYLRQRPAIVVRVMEPATVQVAVHGAVENPGVVKLASNELSLFGALSAAGGIIKASNLKTGARIIRIRRPGQELTESTVLPVKGLNVPFADIAFLGGETVEVERWDPELFTVVGLVTKPGAYEYAPGQKINLMQALAIAGGVDQIADPPYATVFRKDANDQIVPATFEISSVAAVKASGVAIRPGDVIVIQHTAGSWTRSLIASVFRAQLNFLVDPIDR